MRRFILLRVEDLSGSSGTGRVAEGVVSGDGRVVVFFEDSIKLIPSVEKLMEVQGHEGRTRLHWQDWAVPPKDKPDERVWEVGVPPPIVRGGALFLVRENKFHVPRVVQWFGDEDGPGWPVPGCEWTRLRL